ncbi:MAG: hypothetical protein BWY06_02414 [Candidatus Latescibacteria bacterium ADurb.Bin168]|nr:MAG: hypothetical protein BWY06_02414 [Candidatus Latescibacteria bacterium ADurb.Bin168]
MRRIRPQQFSDANLNVARLLLVSRHALHNICVCGIPSVFLLEKKLLASQATGSGFTFDTLGYDGICALMVSGCVIVPVVVALPDTAAPYEAESICTFTARCEANTGLSLLCKHGSPACPPLICRAGNVPVAPHGRPEMEPLDCFRGSAVLSDDNSRGESVLTHERHREIMRVRTTPPRNQQCGEIPLSAGSVPHTPVDHFRAQGPTPCRHD